MSERQTLEDLLAVPMPGERRGRVPFLDEVVRRSLHTLLLLAAGGAAIWFAIGDEDPGVTSWPALIVGGAILLVALVRAVTVVMGFVALRNQVRRTDGRPGTARALVTMGVLLVALLAVGIPTGTRVSKAVGDQRAADRAADAAEARARAALGGLSGDARANLDQIHNLVRARPGVCLTWAEGPTKADPLDQLANPDAIAYAECSSTHGYEVVGSVDLTGLKGGYPGGRTLTNFATTPCLDALRQYLAPKGKPPVASTNWGSYVVAPGPRSWAEPKERRVVCVATPPAYGFTRKGSLAHSG